MTRLAAVGDNCIDAYPALERYLPGGNCVNVSVWFTRLGGFASYIGMVGDDRFGTVLRQALQHEAVDTSHVHVLPGKTAVTLVDLVEGERVFGEYDEGVSKRFALSSEDLAFIAGHDAVHSGVWGHAEPYLPQLRHAGRPLCFDFSDRLHDDIVAGTLPLVDYAFFSHPGQDAFIEDYLVKAQRQGPKWVVGMLGAHGSIGFDGRTLVRVPALPTTLVDTMGAGDSFIAGFITAALAGTPLRECMLAGAAVAARAIACPGAW